MATVATGKGKGSSSSHKLQLVAKDRSKRARSFAYDGLSGPTQLLDSCVSLHWSEGEAGGSGGRRSCGDTGCGSVITNSEADVLAAGAVDSDTVMTAMERRLLKCRDSIKKGVCDLRVKDFEGAAVVVGALFFVGFLFLLYMASGLPSVQHAARISGGLDYLVLATKQAGGARKIAMLHLVQRLIKNNFKNAERVADLELFQHLEDFLRRDPPSGKNAMKVAVLSTIGMLATEMPNASKSLNVSHAIENLVTVVKESRSSHEKNAMLDTLADLLETSRAFNLDSGVRADVNESLIDVLGHGKTAEVVAAAWALGKLWRTNPDCTLVRQTGGLTALIHLVDSSKKKLVTHASLIALGNLLLTCPEFRTSKETTALMRILVRLLADTVDPRWSSLKVQVTDVDADKISHIKSHMLAGDMDPAAAAANMFACPAHTRSNRQGEVVYNLERRDQPYAGYREPRIILTNLVSAVKIIGSSSERSDNQDWLPNEARRHLDNHPVRLLSAHILSQNDLAAGASWVIGCLATGTRHQQDALRQVGGIEILVKVLDLSLVNPLGGQHAALALARSVADNIANKIIVTQTAGVEVLLHLIGFEHNEDLALSAMTCVKAIAWGVHRLIC